MRSRNAVKGLDDELGLPSMWDLEAFLPHCVCVCRSLLPFGLGPGHPQSLALCSNRPGAQRVKKRCRDLQPGAAWSEGGEPLVRRSEWGLGYDESNFASALSKCSTGWLSGGVGRGNRGELNLWGTPGDSEVRARQGPILPSRPIFLVGTGRRPKLYTHPPASRNQVAATARFPLPYDQPQSTTFRISHPVRTECIAAGRRPGAVCAPGHLFFCKSHCVRGGAAGFCMGVGSGSSIVLELS